MRLRLDRLQLDSGSGSEAAALHVVVAEPLIARQPGLGILEAVRDTPGDLTREELREDCRVSTKERRLNSPR
jgi:hypothetical protein